jgi:hypothetical protein
MKIEITFYDSYEDEKKKTSSSHDSIEEFMDSWGLPDSESTKQRLLNEQIVRFDEYGDKTNDPQFYDKDDTIFSIKILR